MASIIIPCDKMNAHATTRRSKPIAIKHDCHLLQLEEEENREMCEKQFYESATWRLYNRIVDHRLNTPPRASAPIHHPCANTQVNCSPSLVEASSCSPTVAVVRPQPRYARPHSNMVFPNMTGDILIPVMSCSASYHEQTLLDGEIFELEL